MSTCLVWRRPDIKFYLPRFSWLRKLYKGHEDRQWYQVANNCLTNSRRPSLKAHFKLGLMVPSWIKTTEKISFWSSIFAAGAHFQKLINELDPVSALFTMAGLEGHSVLQMQGQLTYKNSTIKEMMDKSVTR